MLEVGVRFSGRLHFLFAIDVVWWRFGANLLSFSFFWVRDIVFWRFGFDSVVVFIFLDELCYVVEVWFRFPSQPCFAA